jgi:hypothetical protein
LIRLATSPLYGRRPDLDEESDGVLSGALVLSSPQPNRARKAPDAASRAIHALRFISTSTRNQRLSLIECCLWGPYMKIGIQA